ncbi:unnamed protein product [Caretta caretta]
MCSEGPAKTIYSLVISSLCGKGNMPSKDDRVPHILDRDRIKKTTPGGGYSVVFLQETHTDPAAEDTWQLEWGDRVYFSHLTVRTAGVANLFSSNLRPEVLRVAEAVLGRLLYLRIRMEGLVVNLVNVYAPTSGPEQLHLYQQASTFLGTLDLHECLVLGRDFNTTLEESRPPRTSSER